MDIVLHNQFLIINKQPKKIAFLGNSVTAQREGYRTVFSELIQQKFDSEMLFVNAGIGGVGSLACVFLMDQFVLRHTPDFCFIECYVADFGFATPLHQISTSIEAIVRKLINASIQPCFVNLFRLDQPGNPEIQKIYRQISDYYSIPTISITQDNLNYYDAIELNLNSLFYDGIHTSPKGSKLFGEIIFSSFVDLMKKGKSINQVLPKRISLEDLSKTTVKAIELNDLESEIPLKVGHFKLIMKYTETGVNQELIFKQMDANLYGFLVIVDDASGVVQIDVDDKRIDVQLADQWSNQPRIQAILLKGISLKNTCLKIKLTDKNKGKWTANGKESSYDSTGTSLKLIGLMVSFPSNSVS